MNYKIMVLSVFILVVVSIGSVAGDAGYSFLSKDSSEVFISASDLLKLIDDNGDGTPYGPGDDPQNDPLILSVRKAKDYEKAHIPGAICIAPVWPATLKNLPMLDAALQQHNAKTGNNEIVIYCYTGHASSLITGALLALGYNARDMENGFCYGWKNDPSLGCICGIAHKPFTPPTPVDGPIEKEPHYITNSIPIELSPSKEKAITYLSKGTSNIVWPKTCCGIIGLLDIIDDNKDGIPYDDGDNLNNDPLIVDIREKDDYEKGHIPGAVWIASGLEMAKQENLEKLQAALNEHKNRTGNDEVLVYSYTQHDAGIIAGLLGTLGYNAKVLRYGICYGWNNDPAIGCGKIFPKPIDGAIEGTVVKTSPPQFPQVPLKRTQAKSICGPTVILLFSLLPCYLLGRRKKHS